MPDGKTIAWSQKTYSKEYATFQLPCGKCLECRLEYSRQWAIRCMHEAQMHEKSCFITLTYGDDHLLDPKLNYRDFQLFQYRLRDHIRRKEQGNKSNEEVKISIFVTGEYGDKTKRPHWHAIIFNWRPSDCEYLRTNECGDRIYKSKILDDLWGKNDPVKKPNEIGDVTFKSAGYVARYAAKKLVHGNDDDHDFHPISKKSSKNAIGKSFIEKYWRTVFALGEIITHDSHHCPIPRYYEKWFKKNKPAQWRRYVTGKKLTAMRKASEREKNVQSQEERANDIRRARQKHQFTKVRTKKEARKRILEQKFAKLQSFQKET